MNEAIVVCVNYLDFLKITYFRNFKFFDNYIVVTSSEDISTQNFCNENDISCVVTDIFYQNGDSFNKGLAINEGIKKLKFKDWVTIMDADTILPKEFGEINFSEKSIEKMYGARRTFIRNYQDLQDLEEGKKVLNEFSTPHGFAFGYLQIFNCNSIICKKENLESIYPSYPNARESDWMFFNKWGDFIRGFDYKSWTEGLEELPFFCISLGEDGKNHFGRISEQFV